MKLEEIILHVGLPKTGSTSIQEFLFDNRDILAQHGYLYPECWNDVNHSIVLQNFFTSTPERYPYNISNGITSSKSIEKINQVNLNALLTEINETKCNRLILSAESISMLRLISDDLHKVQPFLYNTFRYETIKVILYVRNPISFATSLYQQNSITAGASVPDRNFKSRQQGIFWKIIPSLWEAFGKENVVIIQFEEAVKSEEGLVQDFIAKAGLPHLQMAHNQNITHSNTGKSLEVVEFAIFSNTREPLYIESKNGKGLLANPRRSLYDLAPLYDVPGTKFDVTYKKKEEYFNIFYTDIVFLKENVGIDYTDALENTSKQIPVSKYASETIAALQKAFPKLSMCLKSLFLDYFYGLYQKTNDAKFLPLFQQGSLPEICEAFTKRFNNYMTQNPEELSALDVLANHNKTQPSGDFLKLFLASASEPFSEDTALSFPFHQQQENFSISFDFDCLDNIRKIRLDPSLYPCVILLRWVMINGEPAIPTGGNYVNTFEGVYTFLTCDPQLLFESPEPITKLEIEISVESTSYALSFCIHKAFIEVQHSVATLKDELKETKEFATHLQQNLSRNEELLQEKDRELNQQQRWNGEKDRELNQQQRRLGELEALTSYYQNSLSWKLTKPLRFAKNLINKKQETL